MTLSFWRLSHLALALFSALFLILASVTGVILAVDAIQEKTPPYKVANFDTLTLDKTIVAVRKVYPDITSVRVDHNQFVILEGIDGQDQDVNAYIDPKTGKILGKPEKKNEFILWTTALHRSLFLKETGRFIVGFISMLLVLISISGLALLIKRQQSFRGLFSKIVKENFAQYYHIVLGRWSLIPILILAATGTFLTLEKFNFFMDSTEKEAKNTTTITHTPTKKTAQSFFKNTLLSDIQKIEFPFSDDPEENYIITLGDKEIEVNQLTGAIVRVTPFPLQTLISSWSLNLHTGRTSILWALILGFASINILFFIYSGFAMTLKRRSSRIKNKFKKDQSNIIILVGSENGSTLVFANAIQKQLIAAGNKVFLTELNSYQTYPQAEHILVFTATHGLGDAPANATKFTSLVNQNGQNQKINFSVLGFGSRAYPDFCEFATTVDSVLEEQDWAVRLLDLQTVNDKSVAEFIEWVRLWNAKTGILLATTPSLYNAVPKGLKKLVVLDKTEVTPTDLTFIMNLGYAKRNKIKSGDLLAIYPANDNQERLYSVGMLQDTMQLVVKLHPHGLGSRYLYHLKKGDVFEGRILPNPSFYFPVQATKIAMISNGTGIAPFLGMVDQNKTKVPTYLYCGFRKKTETVQGYEFFLNEMIEKKRLTEFHVALSREENAMYVMDLIQRDDSFFIELLGSGGVIMICGSLAMQQDVERVLDTICLEHTGVGIAFYKNKNQILSDCY
ncbi:PepSY domain-containing protein [Flavobacterium tiangeerense]|uniref:PepSY domain-containing protein n=1 Tax=Flavobacterium tiangeerense TaxID=459471 RepID=UPI00119EAA55|nr:PepSY domain-containing protein [Flavobacterium tiangeerense]